VRPQWAEIRGTWGIKLRRLAKSGGIEQEYLYRRVSEPGSQQIRGLKDEE
jgi:hypothetical protein